MAKLTYQERKGLPKSSFIFKSGGPAGKGRYPIEDVAHARNALARVAQNGTPAEKATVRRRVFSKYPQIDKNKKK